MTNQNRNLTVMVNNLIYTFEMRDGTQYKDKLIKYILPGYKYVVRSKTNSKYYIHKLQSILDSLLEDHTLDASSVIFLNYNGLYIVLIGTNNDKYAQYDRSNETLDDQCKED